VVRQDAGLIFGLVVGGVAPSRAPAWQAPGQRIYLGTPGIRAMSARQQAVALIPQVPRLQCAYLQADEHRLNIGFSATVSKPT
jgi:hypothetical protein